MNEAVRLDAKEQKKRKEKKTQVRIVGQPPRPRSYVASSLCAMF